MAHGDHGDHGIGQVLTVLVRARIAPRLRALVPEHELVRLAGRALVAHHLEAELVDPCATLRVYLREAWELGQDDAQALALELLRFRRFTTRDVVEAYDAADASLEVEPVDLGMHQRHRRD
jgi:hypothetical protein